MKNQPITFWIALGIIIVVLAMLLSYYSKDNGSNTPNTDGTSTAPVVNNTNNIVGCYVARIGKTGEQDVYTLTIKSDNNGTVQGNLEYDNYQKDSSNGPLVGTYADGVLVGDHSFNSEGMSSVRQVVFKKVANGFIEGFGPITVEGNHAKISDFAKVSYEDGTSFVKEECSTNE